MKSLHPQFGSRGSRRLGTVLCRPRHAPCGSARVHNSRRPARANPRDPLHQHERRLAENGRKRGAWTVNPSAYAYADSNPAPAAL
jgi:hypothetical protein